MTSSYTPNKKIEKPAYNDYASTPTGWSGPVNTDWDIIDQAFGTTTTITVSTSATPPVYVLADTEYRSLAILITGAISADITVQIPSAIGGMWIIRNATTDGTGGPWNVYITSGGGGTYVPAPRGYTSTIYSDGTNVRYADNRLPTAAGSDRQVQFNNNGVLGASSNLVFNTSGLDVTGYVHSTGSVTADAQIINTVGGYKFPDNTVQTTAAQTVIPSGTRVLFFQAAAPTGWTQYAGVSDRVLRVVSTTGAGTGGTYPFSQYFSGSGLVGSTTLTEAQMPSHTHVVNDPGHNHTYPVSGNSSIYGYQPTGSGPSYDREVSTSTTGIYLSATGGSTGHSHTIPSLQYADVIICTKD